MVNIMDYTEYKLMKTIFSVGFTSYNLKYLKIKT